MMTDKPLGERYVREPKTLGDHIRNRRLELGLLQREVAEIVGANEATVYNWENGRVEPVIKYYPGIIAFLGHFPFDMDSHSLGGAIKRYCFTFGLSRKRFAKLMGVDETTVWGWVVVGKVPLRKHQEKLKELRVKVG